MVKQIAILNAEKWILGNGRFWKPINRQRALGGGWGGGGPHPSLPSNVVLQCTTCTTLNQDLPNQTKAHWTLLSLKISWKNCKLEVRRAFCNNSNYYCIKSLKKCPKKKRCDKSMCLKISWKKCKLEVRRVF